MKSGSSELTISGGQYGWTFSFSSCHHLSRPSFQATLPPVRWRQRTCSTSGHSASAASTMDLVAMDLPPRLPSSVVMTTRDLASWTRSRRDSAEKPAKTTEWTAPRRAHARKAIAASGTLGGGGRSACEMEAYAQRSVHGEVNRDSLIKDFKQQSALRWGSWAQSRATHVSLLDAEALEDVGGLADLAKELLVGELNVLSRLIGFPDDGSLSRGGERGEMRKSAPVRGFPKFFAAASGGRRM